MKTICAECGKELIRLPCRIKERNYCNGKCQMQYEYKNGIRDKFKTVEKAQEAVRKKSKERFKTKPNTKINKRGYKMIYIPIKGWVKEHTYIWENANEKIKPGQILHHIDGNKLNNSLSNLMLFPNNSAHIKYHKKGV